MKSSVRNFKQELADEKFRVLLNSNEVYTQPSFQKLLDEFITGMDSKKTLPELEDHIARFVKACVAVGGPVAAAAESLSKDWSRLK